MLGYCRFKILTPGCMPSKRTFSPGKGKILSCSIWLKQISVKVNWVKKVNKWPFLFAIFLEFRSVYFSFKWAKSSIKRPTSNTCWVRKPSIVTAIFHLVATKSYQQSTKVNIFLFLSLALLFSFNPKRSRWISLYKLFLISMPLKYM